MAMKFCSQCGHLLSHEMVSGRERQVCGNCRHIVFQNPLPVAVVIVTEGDRVLLVKRANKPLQGYWAPPSGYIEIDETVEDGAAREVREETGYDIKIERLIGVQSQPDAGVVFLIYKGIITGGSPDRDIIETLDVKLFSKDELPVQNFPHDLPELDRWFFKVSSELLGRFGTL